MFTKKTKLINLSLFKPSEILPKKINKTQNYTIQYNVNGATKYGFIEKVYLCEGSFYFLVKNLRKSTNNQLLNNSTGQIMKNIENDNNFFTIT